MSAPPTGASAMVKRWAQDVARLVVPVTCPGCGVFDELLCDDCAAPWWEDPLRCESSAPRLDVLGREPLPVWSVASLEGSCHGVVAAWKGGARRDLDPVMRDAIRRAAGAIAGSCDVGRGLVVVPAPSRPASVRQRGVDLTWQLARAAAQGLDHAGVQASAARHLHIRAGESRTASAQARWRDAHRSVRLERAISAGTPVLMVDDVVTTGATLAACAKVLEAAGAVPIAALCVASATVVSKVGP